MTPPDSQSFIALLRRVAIPLVLVLLSTAPAGAQWTEQKLTLRRGWNAIHLEVQPEPGSCGLVFSNAPIESVWMWNKRFSPIQYIVDPNTLLPGQPDWLTYLPATSSNTTVSTLHALRGGQPYLIKAAADFSITVRGRPTIRTPDWLADSFNLVGFAVSSNSPPTFQNFLAPSPAHSAQPVFSLNATGAWIQVISPSTTRINRGESYWIRSSGPSTYAGPTRIDFEQGRTMDFGRSMVEQTLRIENRGSSTAVYTLRKSPSSPPPPGHGVAMAGDVPLSYWRMNLASNLVGWAALEQPLVSDPVPPGATWTLRLAVRRADMTPFILPPGFTDATYQSLLELSDTAGMMQVVPVSSKGLSQHGTVSANAPQAIALASAAPPPDSRAGLWVGSVVLDHVNQTAVSSTPVPTASQFQFKLIVHVDQSGDARLLQKVVIGWTNGIYSTNASGYRETVSPGRYVLVTDNSMLGRFSGSSLRDGVPAGIRISSAAFGFRDPILMTRSARFGLPGTLLACSVPLGFDDSTNPFKHRYHPDHNNLDDRFENIRSESPALTREIALQFTAGDPDSATLAGWGDTQLGGTYSETITGLHKQPVTAQGTFRLTRASAVPVLNDSPQ